MMRLLFVNHLHPDSGLVGAVRLQRMAEELAHRGHRVILLCGDGNSPPDTPVSLAERAPVHDWSRPLVLAVHDTSPRQRRSRPAGGRRLLHRAATAAGLVVHGGPFWRWQRAARAFEEPIHQLITPELTFATFGNLDALAIARGYARRFAVPWVMDIKDPASSFIPKPINGWLMPRYRDAAAVTLNSEFQRSHNPGWASERSTVLYSGVETPPLVAEGHSTSEVALVGSTYGEAALAVLLQGFQAWRQRHQPDATLRYFGADGARVAELAKQVDGTAGVIVEGQIARAELLRRCARMAALLYSSSPQHAFHHKLLELAVLGRPLITCPDEGIEARALCTRYGIRLTHVTCAGETAEALHTAARTETTPLQALRDALAWPSVATRLEAVFTNVLATATTTGHHP